MSSYMPFYFLGTYLLCSIPFGKLLASAVGRIDITKKGSGNIGATNVARQLGTKWGMLTLTLDVLKGFFPAALFRYLQPESGPVFQWELAAVSLIAVLGHQFSAFLSFRGGKGVATALGVFMAISPLPSLLTLLVFILIVTISRFVSLGSMVSAFALPIFLFLFGEPEAVFIASILVAILICVRHRDNLRRLSRGEETKWRKGQVSPAAREVDPALHQSRSE
jgi:glycerol-3-phosphate acyltransferase PlsY